ncbi:MAG: histidine kinase [Bacteroidia bacterium]|nr:histidine kinase [Bacteroidia bacterium]
MTKPRFKEIVIHFLFWAAYIASEYLANMSHISLQQRIDFLLTTLYTLPLLMVPTYFIALFAVPRYLRREKIGMFALTVLGVAILLFYSRLRLMELINYLQDDVYFQIPPSKIAKNIIRDYSLIALAVCLYIIGDWRKKEKMNTQLIRAKADAEIQLLRAQLHPHFLFNTLNNIYSLALSNSDRVADSILRLTELLEYLVYWASKETVPLAREVQLIHNYLELERLRYGDMLDLEVDLPDQNHSLPVSPLILLPFVENCFKHGGKGKNGKFEVKLSLDVSSKLLFHIQNSKKYPPKAANGNGGLGLENIRKRLELVYPGLHRLEIVEDEDFFTVNLELELGHE